MDQYDFKLDWTFVLKGFKFIIWTFFSDRCVQSISNVIVAPAKSKISFLFLPHRPHLSAEMYTRNPIIFNIIHWLTGSMGQMTFCSWTKCLMFQASFFSMISYRLRVLKILYFYCCKIIKKNKLKRFLQRFLPEIMKNK